MPNIPQIMTTLTKADAMIPIIALESVVVSGRTIQAEKRGGKNEARERLIEEATGSIVWLCGVKYLNDFGDKILDKVLDCKGKSFDVGTDNVLRKPFENFMAGCKKYTQKQVAMMKGAKVLSSIIIADTFIGFCVPKINHAITTKILHKENERQKQQQVDTLELTSKQQASPTFKGNFSGLNAFTNVIENTNIGKLLSTDIGIAGGRMCNARTKEERREIAIRDLGSIYFYMWAQGHVCKLLNKIETGNSNRLNPSSAELLSNYMKEIVGDKGITVEEFKKIMLGENKVTQLSKEIEDIFECGKLSPFEKFADLFSNKKTEPLKVAKISSLEKIIKDTALMDKIRQMSKLQPLRCGEAVVTKQQILAAMNDAKLNNPEFLQKVYTEFTGGRSTDPYKYVSYNKLLKLRKDMENYVERLCKNSKDKNITKEFISNVQKKNLNATTANFAVGFLVAATFLSTLIPKFQYYITRKMTGVNEFPGTYDYENHKQKEF